MPPSVKLLAILLALAIGLETSSRAQKALSSSLAQKPEQPVPTLENVAYGPYPRNVLDFWKAASPTPGPVLVCIHGGGFVSGDKSSYRSSGIVAACLSRGISVVSINYRYTSTAPYPAPMLDGARAVQFIRSKAKEWGIDPARIGTTGNSAGANMAVWLGCHPDFADKDSADEVARQSTKLSFVCGHGAQTFNDPALIRQYIYSGASPGPSAMMFYGVTKPEDLNSDRVKKLGYDASAINFVSKDAPPFYLSYGGQAKLADAPYPEGTSFGVFIHSPKFGAVFKEKCDALGVECILHYRDNPEKPGEELAFVLKHFGIK